MYNRYIRNDAGRYERIPVEEAPPPPNTGGPEPSPGPGGAGGFTPPPGGRPAATRKGGVYGIMEKLNLKDIDTGDLILLLIIFLLFREGGDEELLIALGLLLIL